MQETVFFLTLFLLLDHPFEFYVLGRVALVPGLGTWSFKLVTVSLWTGVENLIMLSCLLFL